MSVLTESDTPLKGCPLAVIDTETTGLDPVAGRIVDIAVIHHTLGSDEAPVVAFSSPVRPGIPIPPEVSRIHGITDEMVAGSPAWPFVEEAVLSALEAYRLLWGHINAKRAPWAQNPWVWVVSFRRALPDNLGATNEI